MFGYIINEVSATLVNYGTGNECVIFKTDPRFDKFIEFIKAKDYDAAEKFGSIKLAVSSFMTTNSVAGTNYDGNFTFRICDGIGYYKFATFPERQLNDVLVKRICKMRAEGFDCAPLINFIGNLVQNPSQTAIDELFLFIEKTNLPITEDGYFIAYKIVKHDYTDIYTGKFDNSVGRTVSMSRCDVDSNRDNHCSTGLHFCSKDYLSHYGSGRRDSDRCVLVKINPADVVSIPSDYNNSKGRTWKYTVVAEMASEWRNDLTDHDYNDVSVVSVENKYGTEVAHTGTVTADNGFFYNRSLARWNDKSGRIVARMTVAMNSNLSVKAILDYEADQWI